MFCKIIRSILRRGSFLNDIGKIVNHREDSKIFRGYSKYSKHSLKFPLESRESRSLGLSVACYICLYICFFYISEYFWLIYYLLELGLFLSFLQNYLHYLVEKFLS